MSQEPPFYGPVRATDKTESKVLYIVIDSKTDIRMYNQPPPFDLRTYVGDFGHYWQIRRIKRGWLLSTFIITIENTEFECKAENKFGDAIVKYTSR
jgi:hypothetical protein